ncbi:MAG: glycoside hydrolase [Bacteroidales bacterium]|nr:glycoside hydrolase [Candidatus Cryptobacteroides caccocaballi]
MKRFFLTVAAGLCLVACAPKGIQKPWDKGGLETHKYRNVFAEMGYSQAEIDQKLDEIYKEVFEGPNKVYFEVGDSLGYVSDIKNYDARTEGMSYGLMVAVQLDKKDVFDRIWRWAKKYMQYQDGPMKGYFAWSLATDGTIKGRGPASDGELYFVTSLIFASNRWGNDGDINYLAEAQNILNCSWEKDGSEDGIMPFINKEHHLITFTPDGFGVNYTDPSYHLPAFYEVWARWANDGRADFYRECAKASREYLHKSINSETGLNPDYNNYDGSFMKRFGGREEKTFRYDSWRVPMNIALDYSWACADKEWQNNYANTIQSFLYSQGIDDFVDQYNVDGTTPDFIWSAGQSAYQGNGLRHSVGFVATAAAVTLAADNDICGEFVERLWNSKNEPYEDGYFDAYYDGLLRLFAFMHLSGNYRVIEPAK